MSPSVTAAASSFATAGVVPPSPLAVGTTGTPPYAGLLFLATFVSLIGVFLTLHGGAVYALLLWEGTTGVAAWVYIHPAVGVFLFAAAAFQAPMAAHLWGDPLHVRRRLWWLLQTVVVAIDER